MSKTVTRFDPTPERSPEECERHYVAVHVPLAQDMLRAMPGLRSYHPGRAVAQADAAGGFAQRPAAWRFVVLRFEPGAALAFEPEEARLVADDHVNCLWRLRSCRVEETVALDRRASPLALAKLLVEVDRRPGADPAAARAAFDALAERVRTVMAGAFGARLLLVDHVVDEAETAPIAVEGQRPTGRRIPSEKVGYLECYFDHPRWGREALGPLAAHGGLGHAALGSPSIYEVEEQAALDLTST